jgi:hypothetical protein
LHQTRIFDVHAVGMQTPSATRISHEPGAQNHSTRAISCLMECPQTEELACERRPQTHRAVIESSTACPFSHEQGPAGPRFPGGGRSYPQQNEHAYVLARPPDKPENTLRQCVVAVARQSLDALRGAGTIADDAYHPSRTRARLVGAQPKPAHE